MRIASAAMLSFVSAFNSFLRFRLCEIYLQIPIPSEKFQLYFPSNLLFFKTPFSCLLVSVPQKNLFSNRSSSCDFPIQNLYEAQLSPISLYLFPLCTSPSYSIPPPSPSLSLPQLPHHCLQFVLLFVELPLYIFFIFFCSLSFTLSFSHHTEIRIDGFDDNREALHITM